MRLSQQRGAQKEAGAEHHCSITTSTPTPASTVYVGSFYLLLPMLPLLALLLLLHRNCPCEGQLQQAMLPVTATWVMLVVQNP